MHDFGKEKTRNHTKKAKTISLFCRVFNLNVIIVMYTISLISLFKAKIELVCASELLLVSSTVNILVGECSESMLVLPHSNLGVVNVINSLSLQND